MPLLLWRIVLFFFRFQITFPFSDTFATIITILKFLSPKNGWSDVGQLIDPGRIDYLRAHLQQILDVILKDRIYR